LRLRLRRLGRESFRLISGGEIGVSMSGIGWYSRSRALYELAWRGVDLLIDGWKMHMTVIGNSREALLFWLPHISSLNFTLTIMRLRPC